MGKTNEDVSELLLPIKRLGETYDRKLGATLRGDSTEWERVISCTVRKERSIPPSGGQVANYNMVSNSGVANVPQVGPVVSQY